MDSQKEILLNVYNRLLNLTQQSTETTVYVSKLLNEHEELVSNLSKSIDFTKIRTPYSNTADCQLNKETKKNCAISKENNTMFQFKDGKIRIKPNGSTEIRFRKFGYNKSFCSKDPKEAEIKFRYFLKEINKNFKNKDSNSLTVKNWTETFLNTYKKDTVSPNTLNLYKKICKNHIIKPFGNFELKKITGLQIQKYINKLLESGKGRTTEDLKLLWNGIFTYAINNKLITDNPMTAVIIPRHNRINGKALTLDEEKKFIKKLSGDRFELVYKFMLYTGIRRSETRLLKKTDIDIQNNTITCECTKIKLKNKNERVTRTFPIFPKLKDIISRLPNKDLIFSYDTTELTQHFKELMPNHHLHDLRHTFTTRARECGIDNEIVSLWTGHSLGNNITATVYTHFSMEFQQKEALKLKY